MSTNKRGRTGKEQLKKLKEKPVTADLGDLTDSVSVDRFPTESYRDVGNSGYRKEPAPNPDGPDEHPIE